jgi:hypothetical protein
MYTRHFTESNQRRWLAEIAGRIMGAIRSADIQFITQLQFISRLQWNYHEFCIYHFG